MTGWKSPGQKMVGVAEAVKTDDGALKLYEENPKLASNYPSKEAFLKQAKLWRAALSGLPADPNSINWGSGNFEVSKQQENKTTFLKIRCKLPDMIYVTLNWEDDELVGIDIR